MATISGVTLQLNNTEVIVYDGVATSSVRSRLSFSDGGEVLTVGKGANLDPIRLTNLKYPDVDSDAATKSYVDTTARGLRIRAQVRAATKTDADINTAYAAGETLDGYTLTAGDRILLQGQADARDNGIWLVTTGKPTRPLDFEDGNHVSGVYVLVDQGYDFIDRSFVCTTDKGSDTVGANHLEFQQFGARPAAYSGEGLNIGPENKLYVDHSFISHVLIGIFPTSHRCGSVGP